MRVVRDDLGAVTIEALTPSQFAFIVGVVGATNALLGFDDEISRSPMIPSARELYPELHRHAAEHELLDHVDAVISSQQRWKARTAREGTTTPRCARCRRPSPGPRLLPNGGPGKGIPTRETAPGSSRRRNAGFALALC